jgi:hypothetical protein
MQSSFSFSRLFGVIAMQGQEHRVAKTREVAHSSMAHVSLLAQVDFKWLMAGQGWWINPTRFRSDPSYAIGFLRLAMASQSGTLRECAASLQAQIGRETACVSACACSS